jgi:hypothetical protein
MRISLVPLLGLSLAAPVVLAQEPPPPQPAQILRVAGAAAQPPQSQEDLVKLRDEKLAKEWLKKAHWLTDYDEARDVSRGKKKPILAYFTRSYSG